MALQTQDLWTLTRGRPQVDATDLAEAVIVQADEEDLDYRTRLLIRDSLDALQDYWGCDRFQHWFAQVSNSSRLKAIYEEEYDKVGFPSLRKRLMDKTTPELIRQFLEHVGRVIRHETRVFIAGSGALILPGYLSRHTDDIDLIDEVPKEIRENHQVVQELQDDYGLHLGHVQSHYFPSGWINRVHSLGSFGRLQVFLVDVYDVFLSKLFSARIKDMGDMRELVPQLDKATLILNFKETCEPFLAVDRFRQIAQDNWQILFGEALPQ
jgi:hypothetical protein